MARVRTRTERDNEDLVRLYLEDIGRHQLLTKEDEARLAQDIEAGKAAEETLDSVDKGLTRTEKRDLQRLVRKGGDASANSSSRTSGWSCRSPSATRRRACRSSTSCRRATSA